VTMNVTHDLEFLTFQHDTESVKVIQHAKYLDQRSFSSKLIARYTQKLDWLFYLDQ